MPLNKKKNDASNNKVRILDIFHLGVSFEMNMIDWLIDRF